MNLSSRWNRKHFWREVWLGFPVRGAEKHHRAKNRYSVSFYPPPLSCRRTGWPLESKLVTGVICFAKLEQPWQIFFLAWYGWGSFSRHTCLLALAFWSHVDVSCARCMPAHEFPLQKHTASSKSCPHSTTRCSGFSTQTLWCSLLKCRSNSAVMSLYCPAVFGHFIHPPPPHKSRSGGTNPTNQSSQSSLIINQSINQAKDFQWKSRLDWLILIHRWEKLPHGDGFRVGPKSDRTPQNNTVLAFYRENKFYKQSLSKEHFLWKISWNKNLWIKNFVL